jgi:hypothetical protein
MQDEADKGERQSGAARKNSRQERLKLALRENLKRRKAQARGRSEMATTGDGETSDEQTKD